jgi:TolA-binding protein
VAEPAAPTPPESGAAPAAPEPKATTPDAKPPAPAPKSEFSGTAAQAQGLLHLGTNLTDRGDFAAAEIAYRQILNVRGFARSDQKSALLGLGRMFRKKGEFTKAAAVYEKFLKEFPDDERMPDALLDLGRTQRAMGAHRLAISRFYSVINSTLKLPPQGFDHYQLLAKTAQFEIAETHFAAGEFAEASKFFSRLRLLDLAPADRARAHFKAAYAELLGGDLERTVSTLRSYLDQWPDDESVPEARYLLSTTLRRLNRPDEALKATLALLRAEQGRTAADPKRWSYWQRRTGNQLANEFFQGGDALNALAIYLGLVTLSDDLGWRLSITYQIALCHERLRVLDKARAAYRTIVDAAAPPAGANPAPLPPEIADLVRMASWRLAHLDWRDKTEVQLEKFFSTTTGRPPAPPAAPSPAHDTPGSTPAAPKTL